MSNGKNKSKETWHSGSKKAVSSSTKGMGTREKALGTK